MEQVVGKGVIHQIFGRGVIVLAEERYFTVRFENPGVGEKQFLFPQAFDLVLSFENEDALQEEAREAAVQAAAARQRCSAKIAIRCKQEAMMQVRKKKTVRKAPVKK